MSESQFKTRREIIMELEKKVEGLIATNTLIQQALVKTHRTIEDRLTEISRDFYEMNYINKAMLEVGVFDRAVLDEKVNELKIADFEKYSNKENEALGLIDSSEPVRLEDLVVIGTKCNDKAREIFRARLEVQKIEDEALRNAVIGKKAGDAFEHKIRGVNQTVNVVSVYTKKQEVANEATTSSH